MQEQEEREEALSEANDVLASFPDDDELVDADGVLSEAMEEEGED